MATAFTVNCSTYIQMKVDYTATATSTGHSIKAEMFFRRTNSYSGSTYNSMTATITIDGQSATIRSGSQFTIPGNNNNWISAGSTTKTVTHTAAKTITIAGSSSAGTYLSGSGSGTVALSAITVAPTAPTISAVAKSASQVDVTWGTTGLGNPAATVYLYGDTGSTPTTELETKATTGDTIYNHTGRTANTRYYYKATATNSAGSNSSSVVEAVTLPAGVTSLVVKSLTPNSATLTVTYASSGNALTTYANCRLNESGTWDTIDADMQGTTKDITLGPFVPETNNTVEIRVETSAGIGSAKSVTFKTPRDNKGYVGVGGVAKLTKGGYVGVGNVAKKIKAVYVGVNNVAKLAYKAY